MKDNKKTDKKIDNKSYWKDLKEATQTTAKGLSMTWEHFQKSIQSLAKSEFDKSGNANAAQNQSFDINDNSNLGIVTNRYPHEMMPIPDNGRYKLHNEIEDCIVCNKCAEVCPVNCIEINAIRGTEQVGRASDGSPIRFYAAKFDIDMAKCCFCGLCTVVCPTECLTMTKEFDFSETDVNKMTYDFSNLNEQEAIQKQKEWDDFQAQKASKKVVKKPTSMKPIIKKEITKKQEEETKAEKQIVNKSKPIIKPAIKIKKIDSLSNQTNQIKEEKPRINPIKIKLSSKESKSSPDVKSSTTNKKEINDKVIKISPKQKLEKNVTKIGMKNKESDLESNFELND